MSKRIEDHYPIGSLHCTSLHNEYNKKLKMCVIILDHHSESFVDEPYWFSAKALDMDGSIKHYSRADLEFFFPISSHYGV